MERCVLTGGMVGDWSHGGRLEGLVCSGITVEMCGAEGVFGGWSRCSSLGMRFGVGIAVEGDRREGTFRSLDLV